MQPVPPAQVYFQALTGNGPYPDPRNQILAPPPPPTLPHQHHHHHLPYESYYYPAHYYSGNIFANTYHRPPPQIPQPQPRPFLTITQFNYQPIGFHQHAQIPANLMFGPPSNRERRCNGESVCRYYTDLQQQQQQSTQSQGQAKSQSSNNVNSVSSNVNSVKVETDERFSKRNDLKSSSSESFEFTIQPEQIVESVCDEKEPLIWKGNPVDPYATPRIWSNPNTEFYDPLHLENDDLTKFIVNGCLKAEAIAIRNQHRPCFKNIKHLCARTRTDILKPRTTVANIHSQGIPWATKDFIFAFVRLVNCWYILKGYMDDHEGSFGKIENVLIPEFKECYQRWQTMNKEMVKHLMNIFVNLDTGVTLQNAEIYSAFNRLKKTQINDNNNKIVSNASKFLPDTVVEEEEAAEFELENNETFVEDMTKKINYLFSNDSIPVPGILRVKEIFNNIGNGNDEFEAVEEEEEEDEEKDNEFKFYHIPSYLRPEIAVENSEPLESSRIPLEEQQLNNLSKEQIWHNALEKFFPFAKSVLNASNSEDSEKNETEIELFQNSVDILQKDAEDTNFVSSLCFLSTSQEMATATTTTTPLSPQVANKFEKIINSLWNLQFAKYISFEMNLENVPDYYKYINKPIFLCNVMNNLKENKYCHPCEVVRDLRTIVRNSELYVEKHPNWAFEECLTAFSNELETQLADNFKSIQFCAINHNSLHYQSNEDMNN